jgi:hypothetical protein
VGRLERTAGPARQRPQTRPNGRLSAAQAASCYAD